LKNICETGILQRKKQKTSKLETKAFHVAKLFLIIILGHKQETATPHIPEITDLVISIGIQ
jgi:hypothetical protein